MSNDYPVPKLTTDIELFKNQPPEVQKLMKQARKELREKARHDYAVKNIGKQTKRED